MREFIVGGLLVTPLLKFAIIAGLIFLPVRFALVHLNVHKWFWHPMLAEVSIYLCILAIINTA